MIKVFINNFKTICTDNKRNKNTSENCFEHFVQGKRIINIFISLK